MFSLTGAESGFFNLTANGELRFNVSPDFEAPFGGGDNNYTVTINAVSGAQTVTQNVNIAVTDIANSFNIINGNNNANTLNGTAGADQINGLGGNDNLNGAGGNDLLDGGANTDTAIYTGPITNFDFTLDGFNRVVVTDISAGSPNGSDTLGFH